MTEPAGGPAALEAPAELGPGSVLHFDVLTVVPQADGFVVGRAPDGPFVCLPELGARALQALQSGQTVEQATRTVTAPDADEPVDVLDFARSLLRLGFVRGIDDTTLARPRQPGGGVAVALRPRLRWLFAGPMAVVAAACAAGAVALLLAVPAVRPRGVDVFFLSSPAESLAALTVVTYLLAAVHELAHVLAAAAVGVPARLRVTRRLYLLTFETNLTGLWALPARRRVGPLLAGMGFDAIVLFATLAARAAGAGPPRLLAAVALVELSAIVTQFFVFLRTDVYAVMTALLGCTNLRDTTRLLLRRSLRRLSPEQHATLAASRPRDLSVARWYRFVHVAGMGLAVWFFCTYFVPSSWHLLRWLVRTVRSADTGTRQFWEALVLGVILLSPRAATIGVAVRDLLARRAPG